MSIIQCNFCMKEFKSNKILKNHQSSTKYCLKIQNQQTGANMGRVEFKCDGCNNVYTTKQNLSIHTLSCVDLRVKIEISIITQKYDEELANIKNINFKLEHILKCHEKKEIEYEKQLEKKQIEYEKQLEKKDEQIRELQDKMERITTTAISRPTTVQTNTINNKYSYLSPLSLTSDEIKNRVETQVNPYTLCEV